MTARTTPQSNGTPVWLDFWSHDVAALRRFWIDLMGYDITEPDAEHGNFTIAVQESRYVFGIGGALPGTDADVAVLYFATDDVDATYARALELGATSLMAPFDVPEHGRAASLRDPNGALFGLWQADGIVGYGAVDEPGFPCWQDNITSGPAAAADYYRDLFGFTFEPMGPGMLGKLGDDGHFTIGEHGSGAPHWNSYLLVEDLDAATAKAQELGATVKMGPESLGFGRFVHLALPGGAPVGLFESTDQD